MIKVITSASRTKRLTGPPPPDLLAPRGNRARAYTSGLPLPDSFGPLARNLYYAARGQREEGQQAATDCDVWGKEGTDADSSYNTHDSTWQTATRVGAPGAGVDGWPGRQGLETPTTPAREAGRHRPASCVGRPAPRQFLCHAHRKRCQWRPVWWDPVKGLSREHKNHLEREKSLTMTITETDFAPLKKQEK
jgi:hypothetical protein